MDELTWSIADLISLGRTAGPVGMVIGAFIWLLKRGDQRDDAAIALQSENLAEVRRQRDEYRIRAERSEEKLRHLRKAIRECSLEEEEAYE